MRSIWKGAISFGLVTIPVKLYSATEERDVSFHQVHREDGGRIKYKRVCTVDGEDIAKWIVRSGWAIAVPRVAHDYEADEAAAKAAKAGLWAGASESANACTG